MPWNSIALNGGKSHKSLLGGSHREDFFFSPAREDEVFTEG